MGDVGVIVDFMPVVAGLATANGGSNGERVDGQAPCADKRCSQFGYTP